MGSKNTHRCTEAETLVKETVMDSINGLATNFHDKGFIKLVQCLDKA
jgi:hypothetical protein